MEIVDTIEVTRAFEWASLLGPAIVLIGVAVVVLVAGLQFRRQLEADRLQLAQQLTADRIKHAESLAADRERFGEQIEADHRARLLSWRTAADALDRQRSDELHLARHRVEIDMRLDVYGAHLLALDGAIAHYDELLRVVIAQRPRKVARLLVTTDGAIARHDTAYTRTQLVARDDYRTVAAAAQTLLETLATVTSSTTPSIAKKHRKRTITRLRGLHDELTEVARAELRPDTAETTSPP